MSRALCAAVLFFLILSLLVNGPKAFAADGGSSYSLFGIGDLRYMPGTRSAGMGYTGIGLPGANFINALAPATWTRINRTRLEVGMLYEGFNTSDGNKSIYLANADFSGALLAIPIAPQHGVVFVAGFTPYSNINYNFFSQDSAAGVRYTLNQTGTGGIGRGLAGLSYAPAQDISFGASFNYLFGTIDKSMTFSPADPTTYAGGTTTESTTLKGITVSFGGLFQGFGRITESLNPLSLGFVVTSRGNLKTERQNTYQFSSERDSSEKVKGRLTIPAAYGIGLAYQLGERYLFAADYYAQPWGNANLNGINASDVRNSSRFGVGVEQLPSRETIAAWTERVSYRLGFYYHATYYRINGEPISEWGITGGVALPITGETRINVSLEYGSRGTTSGGLVKDNFFRASLSLNISELWFVRYEEE